MDEHPTNLSKPERTIEDYWCNKILYNTIHGKIRFLDVILLIPNGMFLIYLFFGLAVAHTKFTRVRTPIVRTVYTLVFADCITGVCRGFISMFLTVSFLKHHRIDVAIEILWLAWRCFVLAVELCVIMFALFSAQVDSRFGVRNVLLISSIIAGIFTVIQAALEFSQKKSNIFGGKYGLFEHGGMIFWFASSTTFGIVYCLIIILPFTRLSLHHTFPVKKSFYFYCAVLSVVNIVQSVGSGLVAFNGIPAGVCLVDLTTIGYFTLFAPLVYYTFLSDFLGSNTDYLLTTTSNTETYQPIPDKLLEGQDSGDEDSDDEDDEYIPRNIQYGAIS